jgi:hypothetical protein
MDRGSVEEILGRIVFDNESVFLAITLDPRDHDMWSVGSVNLRPNQSANWEQGDGAGMNFDVEIAEPE